MTNPLNTPTSRAIVKAVRGSLRLVGSSSELLTASQLFAVRSDLHETLAIVNGQIQASQSDDQKLVIDLSDWEGSSDEGDEDNGDAPVAARQEREGSHTPGVPPQYVDAGTDPSPPIAVPGPYPVSPPVMDELPEYWYVVDHGTEVGIFADNASSTRAVAGIPRGHQVEVKSWYEAATLYNTLLSKGLIVCVRA